MPGTDNLEFKLVFEGGFEVVDVVEIADVEKAVEYYKNIILRFLS